MDKAIIVMFVITILLGLSSKEPLLSVIIGAVAGFIVYMGEPKEK